MIDHVLGRPSAKSRRLQVLAVLSFWSAYLIRGNKDGPPGVRNFSRLLTKKLTAWHTVLLTMLYLYAARNFSTLVGLASPDPLANMYDATFFRATWVLTALDAGFWTAMKIRTRWLRDLSSVVFSIFYLIAAEKADEKVRKVRGNLTVEHLRVSWNKSTTPYLDFFQHLMRPRLTRWPPRLVRIPRPATSDYHGQPIMAWLYYDGSIDHLRASGINRVILDIPGGGFVAMDPRCNDDRLLSWAVQTGLPVLSLDYKKAPEYPFPFALNECYDAYATLINTRGRCIGLAAQEPVRVVVSGDSAGGNLATAMTLMVAQSAPATFAFDHTERVQEQHQEEQKHKQLPMPEGLVLFYPSLDMNIGNWMSDEQMALIKDRRMRATNKNVIRRKSMQFSDIAGTPHESDDESPLKMTAITKRKDGGDDVAGSSGSGSSDNEATTRSRGEVARSPRPAYSHGNVSCFGKGSGSTAHQNRPQTQAKADLKMASASHVSTFGGGGAVSEDDATATVSYHPEALGTRLATSSTISYFNDRVLTPEMMRAMIILYVGPHNRPDFSRDYLLSPILAPDLLLAHFPKTYFVTGERDPLVDDTVIFAGRLRRIKAAFYASGGRRLEYRESDAMADGFDDRDVAEVVLIPGVSHGFMQFPNIYPPAWKWVERSAQWIDDVFQHADAIRKRGGGGTGLRGRARNKHSARRQHGCSAVDSSPAAKAAEERGATRAETASSLAAHAYQEGNVLHDGFFRASASRRESSGEEDGPLEMTRRTKAKGKVIAQNNARTVPDSSSSGGTEEARLSGTGTDAGDSSSFTTASSATTAASPDGQPADEDRGGDGNNCSTQMGKKKRTATRHRSKGDGKLVKLASSDDLLGRRMQGIVGGLSGVAEE